MSTLRTLQITRVSVTLAAALLVALIATFMTTGGALADAKDINRNATSLTHACAQDGGTATTTTAADGKTSFSCKGGSHGDWSCTGVETNYPTCTKALTGRRFDPIAALQTEAEVMVSDQPVATPTPVKHGSAAAHRAKTVKSTDDLW